MTMMSMSFDVHEPLTTIDDQDVKVLLLENIHADGADFLRNKGYQVETRSAALARQRVPLPWGVMPRRLAMLLLRIRLVPVLPGPHRRPPWPCLPFPHKAASARRAHMAVPLMPREHSLIFRRRCLRFPWKTCSSSPWAPPLSRSTT